MRCCKCARCSRDGVYFNDICDEHGRKTPFYLCEEHQREFRLAVDVFLGLRKAVK